MLVVAAIPVLGAVRGELRQVASPAALVTMVDGAWTNDTLARTIPPALYEYNTDLGVIAYIPSFDTNFIAALEPSTNGAVVLYRVTVTETNTAPRERVYRNTANIPVYTTTVSTAGYPTSWVEDVYGNPPPWLSGPNLADWYANRDPARQRVHVALIATSDVPAYVDMLTNAVGSLTFGTNMIPLLDLYSNDIAFVHLAANNGPNLYLHAPEDIARLDVYDSTNLVDLLGGWLLSVTLDHVSDPLLWTWPGTASNVFFSAGNPDVDSDGDGLADIREIRIYGTDPHNADTDGDGLSDGEEILTYDLDPLDDDSDGDEISDGWEVFVALYPTDPDAGSPVTIAGVFGDYASGGAKSERYVLHALPFGSTNLVAAYGSWTNATTNTATAFTNTIALGTARTLNLRWWSHAADGRPILYDHDYQWTVDGVPTNTLGWYWLDRCVVDQTRTNALIYSAYTNSTISTNFVTKGHLGNHYVNLPTQDFDFAAPLAATPLANSPPGKRVDVYVPLVDLDPANASNVVADAWIGEGESPGTIMAVSTSALRRVRFTRGPESMPTGTVTLAIVSGADRIRVWRDPAKGATNLLLSASSPSTNWVLTGASTWAVIPTNVWIEAVTNSTTCGDVILAARFTSPASSTLCADTNVFTILKVDLNGDYNRDDNPVDHANEADAVTFAGPKGYVILANNDDDNADGEPDCNQDGSPAQYRINGTADIPDIYELHVAKLGIASNSIPSGMTVEIKVLNPTNETATQDAIIYPKREDGTVGGTTLDFSSAAAVGAYFGGTGTAVLGIEGRKHSKEVRVRITLKLNGSTLGTDEIRVLVAPWMALSNDKQVATIYSGFGDDTAFTTDMNALFGAGNITWENGAIWRQDEGEFGYTRTGVGQSTYTARSVILDLSTTSDDFKALISASKGWDDSVRSLFEHAGGGIEVSVPDATYPYGRLILVADYSGTEGSAFFERQQLQWPPIFLPVAWLYVGHVDEVMSVVPSGSSSVICVGDLTNAIAILKDYTTYPTNEVESGSYSRSNLVSIYTNPANATAVTTIQGYLDSAAATLSSELGVTIIRLPVAYTLDYTGAGNCKTFLPNSVNAAVAKISGAVKVGTPDPRFYPFRQVIENRLSFLGSNRAWINCDTPHALFGEAHCASNPDKIPPSTP